MSKMRKVHKGTDTWEEPNIEREGRVPDQEEIGSRIQEEGKQVLNIMNNEEVGPVQMDEEDREWMEMMEEVNKKQQEKKQKEK